VYDAVAHCMQKLHTRVIVVVVLHQPLLLTAHCI